VAGAAIRNFRIGPSLSNRMESGRPIRIQIEIEASRVHKCFIFWNVTVFRRLLIAAGKCDVLLFVCSSVWFVCLFVCLSLLSHSLRGSTLRRAGDSRIVSDILFCILSIFLSVRANKIKMRWTWLWRYWSVVLCGDDWPWRSFMWCCHVAATVRDYSQAGGVFMRRRKWRKAISRDCIRRGQHRQRRRVNYKLKMTNADGLGLRVACLAVVTAMLYLDSAHRIKLCRVRHLSSLWLMLETRALFGFTLTGFTLMSNEYYAIFAYADL